MGASGFGDGTHPHIRDQSSYANLICFLNAPVLVSLRDSLNILRLHILEKEHNIWIELLSSSNIE